MKVIQAPGSKFFFNLYLLFIVSYLLHFPARVSVLGAIRFDLLIAGVLFIGLLKETHEAKENFAHPITKSLYAILIYIVLTLPFVEWPGSVLKGNLIPFIKSLMFFSLPLSLSIHLQN